MIVTKKRTIKTLKNSLKVLTAKVAGTSTWYSMNFELVYNILDLKFLF